MTKKQIREELKSILKDYHYDSDSEQMSKDVTTFLMWSAEPHLESRHRVGFKVIIYLLVLTILVYFSMKRIWSRIETKI